MKFTAALFSALPLLASAAVCPRQNSLGAFVTSEVSRSLCMSPFASLLRQKADECVQLEFLTTSDRLVRKPKALLEESSSRLPRKPTPIIVSWILPRSSVLEMTVS